MNENKLNIVKDLIELENMILTGIKKLSDYKIRLEEKDLMYNHIRFTYETKSIAAKKDYEEYKSIKSKILKTLRIRERYLSRERNKVNKQQNSIRLYNCFNYEDLSVSNNILNQKKESLKKTLKSLKKQENIKKFKELSPELRRIVLLKKKYSILKISHSNIKVSINNLMFNLRALLHPKNNQVTFSNFLIKTFLDFYKEEGKSTYECRKINQVIINEISKLYKFYRLPVKKYNEDFQLI